MNLVFVLTVVILINTPYVFGQTLNVLSSDKEADSASVGKEYWALTGGGGVSGTSEVPSAAVGVQLWSTKYVTTLLYNLAEGRTISGESEFGSTLLDPGIGGKSFYGGYAKILGNAAILEKFFQTRVDWGLFCRGGVTILDFKGSSNGTLTDTMVSGQIYYASLGVQFLSGIRKIGEENAFQYGVEFAPTIRLFGGNISQKNDFRRSQYGTGKNSFLGGETTIFLRLNSISPYLRITYFPKPNTGHIADFTGVQAFVGVNVLANIFKFPS